MGVVYRAFDEALHRPLAVKHLSSTRTNDSAAQRFRREAQAAARLNHPAIVHIYDIVESEDGDWIVMELVEGQTLSCMIGNQGLGLEKTLRLGREIAEGLAEAHAHGIIHRDLKASNVMVTATGHAKILDFGIAKLMQNESEEDLSQTGIILGTCHAMSPEQAQGLPLDPRSDLFSLGSLLYEMLTGISPFRAGTVPETLRRICSVRQVSACRIRPEIPLDLSDLIDRLLLKSPLHRPQGAAEVAKSLSAPAFFSTTENGRGAQPLESSVGSTIWEAAPPVRESTPASPDPSRLTSERRQVTVVCCELVPAEESAAPSSGAFDPETLHELMLQLRTLAGEVVSRHGGYLENTLGHRMLIYFGYLQTYEDNARRAALTALDLADEVARMKAGSGGSKRLRLALRVGIHTGPAVVATSPHAPEPVTLGATLDLVIQLQSLAEPGGVIVSPAIGLLIQKNFSLEPLPPVTLPGLSAPWTPLRLLRPAQSSEENLVGLLPLVGRDRELDLLLSRWSLVSEGTGQVVLISGEAGIGKSRLVLALRDRLGEGVKWLTCGGSLYTQNSPLRPIIDLLRQAVSLREGASPLDRLENLLRDHALEEALPFLATLLDLPLDERHALPSLPPERQREKTLEALAAWVLDMAEQRPLILLIEDLHWLDPTTLDWLGRLSDQASAVPLFLLLTLRLHTLEAFSGPRTHLTQITLDPLTDSEAKVLIEHVTGASGLPAEVRRQIVARTDGVPLFIEELTKTVLETSSSGERRDLPSTLRDSLTARLDRLGRVKETAQLASALGRVFTLELLAAVSAQGETTLHQDLKQLIQAGLIYRKGFGAQTKYIFKHALVQDAAYDSLLKRERQQIHRQIAETFASRFAETAETQPELLAHHYTEAGLTEPAIDSWVRAGVLASRRSANLEAISHFTQALRQLEDLEEGPERDRRELAIQSPLAAAASAGRSLLDPAVEQGYQRAEILAERLGDTQERFWAVLGLHTYSLALGDLARALQRAESLLAIAGTSGSPMLLSVAYFWLGAYYHYRGDFPAALAHLEKSYEIAPSDDLSYLARTGLDLRVLALSFGSLDLWHVGYPDRARQRGEQAIAIAREIGSQFTLCISLLLGGAVLGHYLRDAEAVRHHAGEAHGIALKLGFPYFHWQTTFLLAWVHLYAPAEGSPAVELQDYSTETIEKTAGGAMDYYFCMHAELLALQDRKEDALRAAEEGLARLQPQGAPSWTGELERIRGEILAASEPAEGERLLRAALDLVRRSGSRSLELRAALGLGRLWKSQGREPEAHALVAGIYRDFTEGFATHELREARDFLDHTQEGT